MAYLFRRQILIFEFSSCTPNLQNRFWTLECRPKNRDFSPKIDFHGFNDFIVQKKLTISPLKWLVSHFLTLKKAINWSCFYDLWLRLFPPLFGCFCLWNPPHSWLSLKYTKIAILWLIHHFPCNVYGLIYTTRNGVSEASNYRVFWVFWWVYPLPWLKTCLSNSIINSNIRLLTTYNNRVPWPTFLCRYDKSIDGVSIDGVLLLNDKA